MKKDEQLLELFFNEPTKHWHFEELLKKASISRPQAVRWLKQFEQEGLVRRVKQCGKHPYYLGNWEHPAYRNRKRLYALEYFYKTGFLNHLESLRGAHTVIIFGSFGRWDWHNGSDIDLFIFGDDAALEYGEYRKKLKREIQVFTAKTRVELRRFSPGLLANIADGFVVKGTTQFQGTPHA